MKCSKEYGYGELALICSNLAKSSEKQLMGESSKLFGALAQFFEENSPREESLNVETLVSQVTEDVQQNYLTLSQESEKHGDRGSLRCSTWGKKVSAIHKSIIARYEKQGEALFEGKKVWVCEACGFIAISEEVPTMCPICKAPSSRFSLIKGEV
jgi:rubrerythrin